MIEGESGVSQALSSIRDRLKRREIVRESSTGSGELFPAEKLIEAVREERITTSIARSELTINAEEVKLLDERISAVRSWVLAHGDRIEPLTDPEEIDLIKIRAKATGFDVRNLDFSQDSGEPVCFEYTIGSYSAFADIDGLEDDALSLIVQEDKKKMAISFDFQNHFSLKILFKDPDNPDLSLYYNSLERPLDEMTPQEYEIIQHYLDRYSKEATSKP